MVLLESRGYGFLGFQDEYLDPDDDVLWKEFDVEGVCSVLFRRGVGMEDGRRAKNGSEELMTTHFFSSELYIDFFFVILLVLNTLFLATAGIKIS
jgi:hypothetical protein